MSIFSFSWGKEKNGNPAPSPPLTIQSWEPIIARDTVALGDSSCYHKNYINLRDTNGRTALVTAIAKGDYATASLLLDKGADPDLSSRDHTPLTLAVEMNDVDIIQLLLSRKTAPNKRNNNHGHTPLTLAAECANVPVAELLLNSGAMVDVSGYDGYTPLTYTVIRDNTQRNTQRVCGDMAPYRNYSGIINLLLAHGANPVISGNNNALVMAKTMTPPPTYLGQLEAAALKRRGTARNTAQKIPEAGPFTFDLPGDAEKAAWTIGRKLGQEITLYPYDIDNGHRGYLVLNSARLVVGYFERNETSTSPTIAIVDINLNAQPWELHGRILSSARADPSFATDEERERFRVIFNRTAQQEALRDNRMTQSWRR